MGYWPESEMVFSSGAGASGAGACGHAAYLEKTHHANPLTSKLVLSIAVLVLVAGCSESSVVVDAPADPSVAADVVLVGGRIYTATGLQDGAQAIAIRDGLVAAVGTDHDVLTLAGRDTRIVDLDGRMVMPGIQDLHTHPLEAMSPLAGTCLLSSQESDAWAFVPELRRCAPNQPATDWVMGFGHSVFTLLESQTPPIVILDAAIPDRPAVMMEETSHSVWVNTRALEAAGITSDTPDPPGGVIVRDASGAPTGILFDSAGDLVMDLAWAPTPKVKDLNYQGLLDALAELRRFGITSVSEGRTYWRREFQDAWLRAERENTLTARAVLALWAYPSQDDAVQIPALRGLFRSSPDALVQISNVKVYTDGILINTTAAMLEPYRELVAPIGSDRGLNYFDESRLARYIAELDPVGFDFHIHAIGDRGVREALNAVESAQWQGRHRISHLEVVAPADVIRFTALDITADMQVAGDFTQPEAWAENEPLIGQRAFPLVPLRDLFETGARVTLSSDWDVSTLNPFVGMQNALTRTPQALPDLDAVLRAYTINPAYALRQEDRTGSLEVGKLADLIILDRDLFEQDVASIGQTRVDLTMLGGKVVYER
ncbi:MAG: putative amidohydrolase YtcJ [Rhodothermales bacterium]